MAVEPFAICNPGLVGGTLRAGQRLDSEYVAYRHGLRASEVCDLQWQQIELSEGRLLHRVKNGIPTVHPIRDDEIRALRKLRRDYLKDTYVFVSERGGPMSPIGFHRLIQRVGEAAKMPFPIHPHMARCRAKSGDIQFGGLT
jgi:type 1 fimbriae regulatory protein FimB/type 1 fimbriae regulatory protein FimE